MIIKNSDTKQFLEKKIGGSLTLGKFIEAIRRGDGISQKEFALKLKISCTHLCDIEKNRKCVSPERAARFAKLLGYSESQFVTLSLQDLVNQAGLKLKVEVRAA